MAQKNHYSSELEKERERLENADLSDEVRDAIFEFLRAYNPDSARAKPTEGEGTIAKSTLRTYGKNLRLTGEKVNLAEATADDINAFMDEKATEITRR